MKLTFFCSKNFVFLVNYYFCSKLLIKNVILFVCFDLVCPFRSFRFPRDNQVTDYVQYRSYFPRLSQGTACMWLDSAKFDSPRTAPVSYAVWGNSNEWLIQLQTQHTISVHFGNVKDVASVSGMCSAEAHKVCSILIK